MCQLQDQAQVQVAVTVLRHVHHQVVLQVRQVVQKIQVGVEDNYEKDSGNISAFYNYSFVNDGA